MKKVSILLIVQVLFAVFIPVNFAHGQIIITSGEEVTAEDLVESILGEGVQFTNVQYQGADTAKGTFTNGSSTNLGIDKGIILTSGYASILQGPNFSCSASGNNGMPGDATLTGMAGQPTFDAAVLQFDFIPETDTLRFKYVFGSEEYDEYVGSVFNDVFGVFITGPNPNGGNYMNENIAVVPGTINNVVINNVNNGWASCLEEPTGPCTNCEFYVANTFGATIEYDGFTAVLIAWKKVVSCEVYHIKIAMADAGDAIFDSGVVIEENSFERPKIEVLTEPYPQGVSDNMIEGCVEADIIFRLPNASYAPITVNFEIVEGSGYAINGSDYEWIDNFIAFEEGHDSVIIHITPIMDNITEGDELIQFIITNELGCEIRYDTVQFIITDYVNMVDTISQPTVICQGQEIDVWVNVANGIPPYTYSWEPGGFTNDTITVMPYTTTNYNVTYTDMCMKTGVDSTEITVFPVCDFETYYFEASNNPGFPYDVYGEVLDDTVIVVFPPGTSLNGLVSSFTTDEEGCYPFVGNEPQESGVTINDFTNLVVYEFWAPGGCFSEWTVIAEVEVGQNEITQSDIQIFPNPAKGHLNILYASGYKVSLVSNLGIEVCTQRIENENQTIDISKLEPGIYYLKFENGKKWFVEKLVIEK